MTKKDFEMIALSFRLTKPRDSLICLQQWEEDISRLADSFEMLFPKFDKEKFLLKSSFKEKEIEHEIPTQ